MLLLDISGSLKAKECDLIVRDKPSRIHDHSSKNGLINGIGIKTVTVSTIPQCGFHMFMRNFADCECECITKMLRA